jgi:cysteine desulfurase/selenocysteine lyase
MDAAAIRAAFPAADRAAYLDNAAVSLVPLPAIEAMDGYYRGIPHNAGLRLTEQTYYGGVGDDADAVTAKVAATRAALARMIGAQPHEIVFTKNTSEALNLVAAGLPLGAGEEVLLSEVEHQAAALPWIRLARERGVRLTWIPASREGLVDPADVQRRITAATRVIALIHVSSLFGTVEPVQAVGRMAARHGVTYVVDAAQSVGRIPVDVRDIECDFLALCGRKGPLGPQGISALFGRADYLGRLRPLMVGSRSAVFRENGDYMLAPIPFRFEAGVLNTAGAIGLGASVEFLEKAGLSGVFGHIAGLGAMLWDAVAACPGVTLYGCRDHVARTGILSFNVEGFDSREVCRRLWERERVITSPGIHGSPLALRKIGAPGTVRASVHCFNTEEQIARLARALRSLTT